MAHGGSHIETEIKLRVPDADAARAMIEARGYTVSAPRIFESNTVHDTADLALRRRGELVRVRRAGPGGILTFKAAPLSGRHKRREELETRVADPGVVEAILERLGLGMIFQYEKYRTEYRRGHEPGVVTLDETPIGTFLELEGNPEWIDAAARELGFKASAYILSSYGALYREYCAQTGVTPTHMVFTAPA